MADKLILIEDEASKRAAQRSLEVSVKAQLKPQGLRNIGFPSGNRDELIFAKGTGQLWCAFGDAEDAPIPRRWNSFGVFDAKKTTQSITVEINIATTSNSASVAGFFARDTGSGAVYLLHDGGVGGGKKGVGRSAFLAWSSRQLVRADRREGGFRDGILIGRIDTRYVTGRLWKYVQEVRAFKDAVDRGEIDAPTFRNKITEWEEYHRESSGRRKGKWKAEIDYVSYHGDVVDALWRERDAAKAPGELVTRSILIDLLVRKDDRITEVFEVKTSTDRQSLYTAVGQLMTHSVGAGPQIGRTLVIPEGAVPDDLLGCMQELAIAVRRFRLDEGSDQKIVLSG